MLKKNKFLLFLLSFFCYAFCAKAQLTDLARLEYSFIPKSKSEDRYNRFRGLINYPIETSKDCYFVLGAEYNRIILELEDGYPFDVSKLNRVHVVDLNLAYTFKTNDNWRFGLKVSPRIASTLTASLSMDDIFLNGGVFAVNDRRKDSTAKNPYRLILGLTYNTTTGLPFPLPFVSYFRRINDKWSFNLGVPKMNLKYHFNESSILQTFITVDGYFANIQEQLVVEDQIADNISMSVIAAGLGYEYSLTKHLVAYGYFGYTLRLTNNLRTVNRDKIYNLDNVNAFYLRTGIKFKI